MFTSVLTFLRWWKVSNLVAADKIIIGRDLVLQAEQPEAAEVTLERLRSRVAMVRLLTTCIMVCATVVGVTLTAFFGLSVVVVVAYVVVVLATGTVTGRVVTVSNGLVSKIVGGGAAAQGGGGSAAAVTVGTSSLAKAWAVPLVASVAIGGGTGVVSNRAADRHWAGACTHHDADGCRRSCDRGRATSCERWGDILSEHATCEMSVPLAGNPSCSDPPVDTEFGPLPRDYVAAASAFRRACALGDDEGCTGLNNLVFTTTAGEGFFGLDSPRNRWLWAQHGDTVALDRGFDRHAAANLRFACGRGNVPSCYSVAELVLAKRTEKLPEEDDPKATFARLCDDRSHAPSCEQAAALVSADERWHFDDRARTLYERDCRSLGNHALGASRCRSAARLLFLVDRDRARTLAEYGCSAHQDQEMCAALRSPEPDEPFLLP